MKLSDFAIRKIAPYIIGDNHPPTRTGPKLVELFNSFGCRDVYDKKGLPLDLKAKSGQRMSRRQYVESRLKQLSESNNDRPIIEQVLNESENKDKISADLNKVLIPEGYSIHYENGKYSIQGGVIDNSKPVQNEAHFEEIQNRILDALDNAKISIWVAMAWFTNEIIFNKLVEKRDGGVEIKLAIYDDVVNRKHGVDFSKLNHTLIKRVDNGGLMHDKFCIIDNQIVITGSYNWTNNAEFKNDENITIQKDPEQATLYSSEFKGLII